MLYDKIRYAEVIRKLYRLRHLLSRDSHPDIASKIGYKKYSKQYYRIKRKLTEQGILDRRGGFVETPTNVWLAELPLYVARRERFEVAGSRAPYALFLAMVLGQSDDPKQLQQELDMSKSTFYHALGTLTKAKLAMTENSSVRLLERGRFHAWLRKYLDLCKTQADTTGDVTLLFDCMHAYIDGPQAYYTLNYEAGRPIAPADMVIRTYAPYRRFWESAKTEVRYFREYPKNIEIADSRTGDRIVWLDGLPYNKKARLKTD